MSTLREQFMERLIREIFQRRGSGFVLKGGAALRSMYGEHRYTRDIDLDFTNPKRTADSLHNTIESGIDKAARALGIREVNVSKPGKGERSPRWKINFADAEGRPIHIEVEVSRDERRSLPGQTRVQVFAPVADRGIARFWVDVYDADALAAGKLAALLGRGLPRDAYDLDVLYSAGAMPDQDQVSWALERSGIGAQESATVLLDRLDALNWDRYESELRDSLVPEAADRVDRHEWRAIRNRVLDSTLPLLEAVRGDVDG